MELVWCWRCSKSLQYFWKKTGEHCYWSALWTVKTHIQSLYLDFSTWKRDPLANGKKGWKTYVFNMSLTLSPVFFYVSHLISSTFQASKLSKLPGIDTLWFESYLNLQPPKSYHGTWALRFNKKSLPHISATWLLPQALEEEQCSPALCLT